MNAKQQPSILLVEDNPDDVDLTRRAFAKTGILNPVEVARDGAEALERLFGPSAGDLPILVILDLHLPKVAGLDVLRRIRAEERTRFLPTVILTTSTEQREVIEGYRLGANAYAKKPVSIDEFIESVARLGLFWLLVNVPAKPGEAG